MKDVQLWYNEKKAARTVEALINNGMNAYYAPTAAEAKKMVMDLVPAGSSIGVGSSLTLSEIGLIDDFNTDQYHLINPTGNIPVETKTELRRQALTTDFFLTGTNAITVGGKLVNIDGTGNRVASMIFGPQNVIVLAGINKVTRTLEEALSRAKQEAAVQNAKKLNRQTPCTQTGKCEDCSSVDRICNITTIIEKKPSVTNLTVIIIGDELGL